MTKFNLSLSFVLLNLFVNVAMIWSYAPLVPSHKLDRIQEVFLCEKALIDDNLNQPLPLFLNLSFDEVCVHLLLHIR